MQSTKGMGSGRVPPILLVKESLYIELNTEQRQIIPTELMSRETSLDVCMTNYSHRIDVQGDQFGCLRHKQIKLVDAYRTLLLKATLKKSSWT